MTNLTTQWIVDNLNNIDKNKANLNLELANMKAELSKSKIVLDIAELELKLKQLSKQEKEIKEQGKQILITAWIKKFEALDWTVIQLNKKAWVLKIEDETISDLDEYRKTKTTISIDKKQLKEDIKQWLIIEWVSIPENYTFVVKNK